MLVGNIEVLFLEDLKRDRHILEYLIVHTAL
jgi:hypothetical protein